MGWQQGYDGSHSANSCVPERCSGCAHTSPAAEDGVAAGTGISAWRPQAKAAAAAQHILFTHTRVHVSHVFVIPLTGLQLLKKMGWRQGRGIGAVVSAGKGRGGSRWGRSAGTAPDPVPVFAPPSKDDRQGLGFDPFKVWTPNKCAPVHCRRNQPRCMHCQLRAW